MYKQRTLSDELSDYIKNNMKKGYTIDSLKWALVNQGYSKIEVEKAIKGVQQEMANQSPVLKTKPAIEHKILEPKIQPIHGEKKSFWKKIFG